MLQMCEAKIDSGVQPLCVDAEGERVPGGRSVRTDADHVLVGGAGVKDHVPAVGVLHGAALHSTRQAKLARLVQQLNRYFAAVPWGSFHWKEASPG